MDERPFTVMQLADRWDFSEDFIMALIRDGALKAFSVSPSGSLQARCLRISEQAIVAFENNDEERNAPLDIFLKGTVYIADAGEFTKIGFTSKTVECRLAAIQVSSPLPVVLWATVPGTMATETGFHIRFAPYRFRGEWFRFPASVRSVLRDLVVENDGHLVN